MNSLGGIFDRATVKDNYNPVAPTTIKMILLKLNENASTLMTNHSRVTGGVNVTHKILPVFVRAAPIDKSA